MEDAKAPPNSNVARQRAYRAKLLAADPEGYRAKKAAEARAYYAAKKTPNLYQQGKVYAIRNTLNDAVYVGSTHLSLALRLSHHSARARQCSGQCRLHAMMGELGFDCFRIELLEEYPCESKEELHAKEAEWINLMATLNHRIPGRSPQEYYIDTHEQRAAYRAARREGVNVKIACELCGRVVRRDSLKYHQKTKLCEKNRPNP